MPRKTKKRNKRIAYSALGIVAVLALVYFVSFSPYALWPWGGTTPVASSNSHFQLISAVDGEDVSSFVEISVWIPDDGEEFPDTVDIYTWSNFEEEESSKDADDVSIDLSDYAYVWIEIDPDGEQVFSNNHYLIRPNGANRDYVYRINHLSSDVNFMALDNTTAPAWYNFTVPAYDGLVATNIDVIMGAGFDTPFGYDGIWNSTGEVLSTFPREAVQENMTLVMNVPEYTFANRHSGTNWAIEESEWDDMSNAELEFHHDEANFRDQAPVYTPADDLLKDGESGLSSVTNAFCLRWTYNDTVSTTDAATTQVNMTITDSTPAEIVIDGTFIYMIFYDVIDFESGAYVVEFEYEEAHRIYATTFQSGRIDVPRDSQGLGAFTAYSVVGL